MRRVQIIVNRFYIGIRILRGVESASVEGETFAPLEGVGLGGGLSDGEEGEKEED